MPRAHLLERVAFYNAKAVACELDNLRPVSPQNIFHWVEDEECETYPTVDVLFTTDRTGWPFERSHVVSIVTCCGSSVKVFLRRKSAVAWFNTMMSRYVQHHRQGGCRVGY